MKEATPPLETMSQKQAFAYILRCSDGSLYAGWTFDLEKRLQAHNEGRGSRYTRTRLPVRLAGFWIFQNKLDAMRFEWQIKHMSRSQKLALCNQPDRSAEKS